MGERGRLSAPAAFVVSLCARPCSAPGFEVWVRGLFSRGFLALSLLLDWPELGSGSVEGRPARVWCGGPDRGWTTQVRGLTSSFLRMRLSTNTAAIYTWGECKCATNARREPRFPADTRPMCFSTAVTMDSALNFAQTATRRGCQESAALQMLMFLATHGSQSCWSRTKVSWERGCGSHRT